MADCPSENCRVRVLTRQQKRQEFTYDPADPQETWQDFKWRILNFTQGLESGGPSGARKKDASADEEPEQVILPNGQCLWVDLPYLVQEFQDAWMKESMGYMAAQREGLAALTARLCAVGVYPSELSCCALWLFKETFETERPLTRVEGEGHATNACVPVVELLPACHAWLKYTSFKLAMFTATNHDYPPPSTGDSVQASTAPEDLAPKSEFPCSGFSIPRWVFWRRRYKHFHHCGNEQIAKLAWACFEEAMFKGTRIGIELPGEKIFLTRIFEALDAEMVARGMQSVEPQHIEIDMDRAGED